jgi:hypothetical protein
MRTLLLTLGVVALLGLTAACASDDESPAASEAAPTSGETPAEAPPLPQGSQPVELDPADFVARIDNEYWPMLPGSRWVYRETDGEGNEQQVEVTVTDETKTILGIEATVVHDVVSEGGELVEDTDDWYAQDTWGNVWYLGEQTVEYEEGEPVTTAGSWEAGVDGAQAGVIMPGHPEVGLAYRQEYYEGEAEDAGEILSLDEQAEVPFGSFGEVLMTYDYTPLDPDAQEHKYYAKGIGPVLVIALPEGSGREELLSFERGS